MPYRLKPKEDIGRSLVRIASEQIDRALAETADRSLSDGDTVHQIRKRCKKVRAVARLFRPFNEKLYQRENRFFRDLARTISDVRDAEVMLETHDRLIDAFRETIETDVFDAIRIEFAKCKEHELAQLAADENRFAGLTAELTTARERAADWPLESMTLQDALNGLAKTYGRGRKAMAKAYAKPTPENFHDWRKRVKYHWYHIRIFRDLWQPVMETRADQTKELSDCLGDAHDLDVLEKQLASLQVDGENARHKEALMALAARRRRELEARAAPLGQRVFALKKKPTQRLLHRYWDAWKENTGA